MAEVSDVLNVTSLLEFNGSRVGFRSLMTVNG